MMSVGKSGRLRDPAGTEIAGSTQGFKHRTQDCAPSRGVRVVAQSLPFLACTGFQIQ
jgi:hypothetical protein